jgi:hypothetical protein
MPGPVPGIHVLEQYSKQNVDGRDKPGHDEVQFIPTWPASQPSIACLRVTPQ